MCVCVVCVCGMCVWCVCVICVWCVCVSVCVWCVCVACVWCVCVICVCGVCVCRYVCGVCVWCVCVSVCVWCVWRHVSLSVCRYVPVCFCLSAISSSTKLNSATINCDRPHRHEHWNHEHRTHNTKCTAVPNNLPNTSTKTANSITSAARPFSASKTTNSHNKQHNTTQHNTTQCNACSSLSPNNPKQPNSSNESTNCLSTTLGGSESRTSSFTNLETVLSFSNV